MILSQKLIVEAIRKWTEFLSGLYVSVITEKQFVAFMYSAKNHSKIYNNTVRKMHESLCHPGVTCLHHFICVKILLCSGNKVRNVVARPNFYKSKVAIGASGKCRVNISPSGARRPIFCWV